MAEQIMKKRIIFIFITLTIGLSIYMYITEIHTRTLNGMSNIPMPNPSKNFFRKFGPKK